MKKSILHTTWLWVFIFTLLFPAVNSLGDSSITEKSEVSTQADTEQNNETITMLSSLIDLQKNLRAQIDLTKTKKKKSSSEAEKEILQNEISQLDKQLSETVSDFERIATGVELALFAEKKPETFSWKDEVSSLLEPAIKELKRFTIRARSKSNLKEKIAELNMLTNTADEAVLHLNQVIKDSPKGTVQKEVVALLPEWQNVKNRLENKLELAQRELANLQAQEVSLFEASSSSLRDFFKNRGLYLILALSTFIAILILCRLLYLLTLKLYFKMGRKKAKPSVQIRLLYVIFKVLSVVLAILGLFFVLYLAEDWFLLSIAIIFFIGMSWTVRQGLPRLWQQGRLMLNVGSVREKERLVLHGVPWRVDSINVFCKLVNPALELELRVPIEDLLGLVSRTYNPAEQWFPCMKGDWVVVNGASRARVISLSHEQVELVERGGKRITYPTDIFLSACPVNLSRNFRLRIPFGVSYAVQGIATSQILIVLKEFLLEKIDQEGYKKNCLNLQVEFFQANTSSLDLMILADFTGHVADISTRLERAINKWCVECCTLHNWEIPFPQLTVHKPN